MVSIIKIGGNVIDHPEARRQFLRDFADLPGPKVLVHGGGKIATQVAEKLGIETLLVEGRRITDQPMLDVVTMVYGGLINKQLVAQLQAFGCNAIGLTGADAGLVRARKRTGWAIDYGLVGDIESVDFTQLGTLLAAGLTPVLAPLTFDETLATLLNTNADTLAQAVATALAQAHAVQLVYCFEKKGVLSDPNDDDAVIPLLTPDAYARYRAEGTISKGMIPKLDNAFQALHEGLTRVVICHATDLTRAATEGTAGTRLVRS